jgi:hypothetical protein
MVAAPPPTPQNKTVSQGETTKEPGEISKMTGELTNMAGKKLLVMTVLERIKALQPIAERELIAQLSVGEPYLSTHKAEELVVSLYSAKRIKYNDGGLLCLM